MPPKMKLIVGVIDSTTNYVEHPEVVADRIERAATRGRRSAPHDWPGPIADSTPARASAWWPTKSCGRNSARLSDGAAIATRRLFG